jgi:hypothetical protein
MWYAHGAFALDKLFNVARTKRVSIFTQLPNAQTMDVMRAALGLDLNHAIDISMEQPRVSLTIDALCIGPDGVVRSGFGGPPARKPLLPFSVALLVSEIDNITAVRIHTLASCYPELRFPDRLIDRIDATLAHLQTIRGEYSEVDLLLQSIDDF